MKIDVIGKTKIWLFISAALIVSAIVSVAVFGLNLGIEFTGGTLIEMELSEVVDPIELKGTVENVGFSATVQPGEGTDMLIRTATISRDEYEQIASAVTESYGEFTELRFESIGPVIGEELKRKSVIAVILLLSLIVLYVAWAFRKVSEPVSSWKYGLLTIIAALHDVLIPLGIFALLGSIANVQIGTAFIAALLTILGYSINDTIVVFDRTRENLLERKHSDEAFADIVNKSVQQSFARSMNTSLTTLLVLLAVYFFGGATTQDFVLALIIGIISGAYSSIFLASPLLVLWQGKRSEV